MNLGDIRILMDSEQKAPTPTASETPTDDNSSLERAIERQRAEVASRINANDRQLKSQLVYRLPISSNDPREALFFKKKDEISASYYGLHPDMGVVELMGSAANELPAKSNTHSSMADILNSAKPELAAPHPLRRIKGNRVSNWERAWRDSAENARKLLEKEELTAEKTLMDKVSEISRDIVPDSMMPTPTETSTEDMLTPTATATPRVFLTPTATPPPEFPTEIPHTIMTETHTPSPTKTATSTPTNTPLPTSTPENYSQPQE